MKKLVSLAVSLVLLAIIYGAIDSAKLLAVLGQSHAGMLGLSIAMVVPLTLLTAWRLARLVPRPLSVGEATRLTLAASVLNMVLPSKMGDIAKAWFMAERGHVAGSLAFALVVFEKTLDMLALLAWCVFGLLVIEDKSLVTSLALVVVGGGLAAGLVMIGSPRAAAAVFGLMARRGNGLGRTAARLREAWAEMHAYLWRNPRRLAEMVFVSLFIWFLHLLQIWLFVLALNAWMPFLANLALAPLALLAGLLPLTFAGIGTRDAALILFYAPWLDQPTAAALGVLCMLRYVLPALLGLPFFHHYFARLREARQGVSS